MLSSIAHPRSAPRHRGLDPPKTNGRAIADDVVIIIPALNEQDGLMSVLQELDASHVIVVNNGSTDQTKGVAIAGGAMVVDEPVRGYGNACLRGLETLQHLIESGFECPSIVGFIDADYSDHPNHFPKLIEPIRSGEADFVLGSRTLGKREKGAMPPQAIWGNRLACFLMKWFWKTDYSDLGPMRAIRYQTLRELEMQDRNYGWTVEMQIKAAKANVPTKEIPVPYRCRIGNSKISGTVSGTIKAGYKILSTIFRYGLVR